MNIMNELRADHKDIRSQLRALRLESEKEKMTELIERLNHFVSQHSSWVSEVIGQLVKTKPIDELAADIMENQEDYQVIENLFSKLKSIKKDEDWFADAKALCELLELHLEDEEELFPKIKQLLPN